MYGGSIMMPPFKRFYNRFFNLSIEMRNEDFFLLHFITTIEKTEFVQSVSNTQMGSYTFHPKIRFKFQISFATQTHISKPKNSLTAAVFLRIRNSFTYISYVARSFHYVKHKFYAVSHPSVIIVHYILVFQSPLGPSLL